MKQNFGFCYHADPCYALSFTDKYNKSLLYWKKQISPPKMRGRPKIHRDGCEVHRLKCLLSHHVKAGNVTRIMEIEEALEGCQ